MRLPDDMIRLGRQLCLHSTTTKEWVQIMEDFRQHYDVDEEVDPIVHARWEGRANRQHLKEDFERLETAMILGQCAEDLANEASIASDSRASPPTPLPSPSVDHSRPQEPGVISSLADGRSALNAPSASRSPFAANSSRRRLPVPRYGVRLRDISRLRTALRRQAAQHEPLQNSDPLCNNHVRPQRPQPPVESAWDERWSVKRVAAEPFLMMGRASLAVLERSGYWGGGSSSTETSNVQVVHTKTTQTTLSTEVTDGRLHGRGGSTQVLNQLAMSETQSGQPRLREYAGVNRQDAHDTSTQNGDNNNKDMETGSADDSGAPVEHFSGGTCCITLAIIQTTVMKWFRPCDAFNELGIADLLFLELLAVVDAPTFAIIDRFYIFGSTEPGDHFFIAISILGSRDGGEGVKRGSLVDEWDEWRRQISPCDMRQRAATWTETGLGVVSGIWYIERIIESSQLILPHVNRGFGVSLSCAGVKFGEMLISTICDHIRAAPRVRLGQSGSLYQFWSSGSRRPGVLNRVKCLSRIITAFDLVTTISTRKPAANDAPTVQRFESHRLRSNSVLVATAAFMMQVEGEPHHPRTAGVGGLLSSMQRTLP
ncbi:hypothetical protein BKA63DRAFT_587565 [Paraphoma chrysanthemicola]|nr:hypothetical protein BKA63DRAFT_587565 [Paraphoma chrysanthemicola]